MKVLDLFSGIGGFSLGLERAGMETVAFCEIEKFPQKVLKKHWPEVPIYDDIRKLTREQLTKDGIGTIDLICGGFPCQPFSQAGKQKGFDDDRDLWPEMFRVIQEVRPRWVIGENVAGFVNMGLDRTLTDLEGAGYRTEQVIIPACAVGAPHRRDRIWIVAWDTQSQRVGNVGGISEGKNADAGGICKDGYVANPSGINGRRNIKRGSGGNNERQLVEGFRSPPSVITQGPSEASGVVADSNHPGLEGGEEAGGDGGDRQKPDDQHSWGCDWRGSQHWAVKSRMGDLVNGVSPWMVEPDIPRVAKGIKDRTSKLKGLGNAVVPQIPEIIGRAIMEIEREKE